MGCIVCAEAVPQERHAWERAGTPIYICAPALAGYSTSAVQYTPAHKRMGCVGEDSGKPSNLEATPMTHKRTPDAHEQKTGGFGGGFGIQGWSGAARG